MVQCGQSSSQRVTHSAEKNDKCDKNFTGDTVSLSMCSADSLEATTSKTSWKDQEKKF